MAAELPLAVAPMVARIPCHYLFLLPELLRRGAPNVLELCNGALAGTVAITALCGVVDVWMGIIVGILGALVFFGLDRLLIRVKVRPGSCA